MASVHRRRRWVAAAVLALVLLGIGRLLGIASGERSQGEGSPASDPASRRAPAAGSQAAPESAPLERLAVGRGARGATVVRQQGPDAGPVVVFLHGWQVAGPRDYRAWISHLARAGNTVIVPRYQGARTPPDRVFANALRGIRSALELVGDPAPLIVVGHSAGAALAADYAAGAASEGLPAPDAVLAIYPGRSILGYPEGIPAVDPAQIDRSTRLVVISSPSDAVVGEGPAQELLAGAVNVPDARKRSVSVTSAKAGDHYAPAGDSAAAQRAFWRRLDDLIDRAGGG